MNKKNSSFKSIVLLHLDLGKEKSGNLGVPSAEHYPVSEGKQIILGTNKPN